MKKSDGQKTPKMTTIFAAGEINPTYVNPDGYRFVLHCSQKKKNTGSKAQRAAQNRPAPDNH